MNEPGCPEKLFIRWSFPLNPQSSGKKASDWLEPSLSYTMHLID